MTSAVAGGGGGGGGGGEGWGGWWLRMKDGVHRLPLSLSTLKNFLLCEHAIFFPRLQQCNRLAKRLQPPGYILDSSVQ